MSGIVYYNGKFDAWEKTKIPLTDRGLFFGDGVYDMAIGRGGKIYQCRKHVKRLLNNAALIGIEQFINEDELVNLLEECVKRSCLFEYTIYFHITRSSSKRIHTAYKAGANLMVAVDDFKISCPKDTVSLIGYEDKRYHYCNIKTLNLLPSVLAASEADARGCDEAVFHRGNIVTECAHSNVFIMNDGSLITHPNCELILPGITAENLICVANETGIRVIRRAFTMQEAYSADELIITSTTRFARIADMLDGVRIGGNDRETAVMLCNKVYENFCKKMEIS